MKTLKKYSFFHPLALSFYSRDLYDDVARNGKGVGFLYLAMLVVVGPLILTIRTSLIFSELARTQAPKILNQIPDIVITRGEASLSVPMPYLIKDPDSGKTIAILDTTGQTTTLEGTSALVLMTKSRLLYKKSASETRIHSFENVRSFTFGKERAAHWLDVTMAWVAPVLFVAIGFVSLVYRCLQTLLYAAIAALFASRRPDRPLSFAACLRIATVALTPAFLLNAVLSATGRSIPFWNFICLAISLGYLYFGVKSVAAAQPETAI